MTRAPTHCIGRSVVPRVGAAAFACTLLLTGCINMSGLGGGSKYACAAPEGVACDSMSGVYANAVQNRLPDQRRALGAAEDRSASTRPQPSPRNAAAARRAGSFDPAAEPEDTASAPTALRSQAQVLRLWTKAWEDADGDLWDQGYVYVQVSTGRWEIEHVRQRTRDRYAPLRPPPAPSRSGSASTSIGGEGARLEQEPVQRPSAPGAAPFFPSLTPPGGRADAPTQ